MMPHPDVTRNNELVELEEELSNYKEKFWEKIKRIRDECPHSIIYHHSDGARWSRRICPKCGLEETGRQLFPSSKDWTDIDFNPLLLSQNGIRLILETEYNEFSAYRIRG